MTLDVGRATEPAESASRPPALLDETAIRAALRDVVDPEIPVISIVDLGLVHAVRVDGDAIVVELLPTFVGCPAIELIRTAVKERIEALAPGSRVDVVISFAQPWTSDRITSVGRDALRRSGLGPPARGHVADPAAGLVTLEAPVPCPHCGSTRTVLENAFGPTPCRSIRYCTSCRQPFEQLKTV